MNINRRQLALGAGASAISLATNAFATAPFAPPNGPRARVLYVNDMSGDIDGLFATVHMILSPSVELRGIVGTGTNAAQGVGVAETAQHSAELATQLLRLMRKTVPVYAGANGRLASATTPVASAGAQAIIDEAMRTDSNLPLYVTVGGGLTEVASALMLEPRIADKFTLMWIGGNPYPAGGPEYNFNIDPRAAQHIFNETTIPIWQVPSSVYAMCQVSDTELQANVAPMGAIGAWLYQQVIDASTRLGGNGHGYGLNTGEGWTLGDSPLVLLTALTAWVPSGGTRSGFLYQNTGASAYDEIFAPRLGSSGAYEAQSSGRKIRAYKSVDTRLMFGDFFAKLRVNYER